MSVTGWPQFGALAALIGLFGSRTIARLTVGPGLLAWGDAMI
jgi:hypothetical protein